MYYHSLFLALLLKSSYLFAQDVVKHKTVPLIYPKNVLKECKIWVDSVHSAYNQQITPTFQVTPHGFCKHIFLKFANSKRAALLKDLQTQITLTEFQKKYIPKISKTSFEILIERSNKNGTPALYLRSHWENDSNLVITPPVTNYKNDTTIHWFYTLGENELRACYFPKGIQAPILPASYARLVGYVDALIDPTISRLLPLEDEKNRRFGKFRTELPNGWINWSKKEQSKLLDDWRRLYIRKSCSQDGRPIRYAIELAQIAASANRWDIFLRAHLKILEKRYQKPCVNCIQTHMRELEAIGINVPDLLLGSNLQVQSTSAHRYRKPTKEIARALLECKDKEIILEQLLNMIKDPMLDILNRYLAATLYIDYLIVLHETTSKTTDSTIAISLIQKTIMTLPPILRKKFDFHLKIISHKTH